jgi:methionyl-tRNA formyltransferase
MVTEIDRGPVIAQRECAIEPWDTSLTVYNKVQELQLQLISETLPDILSNNIKLIETAEGNYNGIGDYKQLCEIDLDQTVKVGDFVNLLRALTHPPYHNAYFLTKDGERVTISLSLECQK